MLNLHLPHGILGGSTYPNCRWKTVNQATKNPHSPYLKGIFQIPGGWMYFFCCTFYSMGFNLNCKACGLLRGTSDSETIPNQKQNICMTLLLIKGTEISPPPAKKKHQFLGNQISSKSFSGQWKKKNTKGISCSGLNISYKKKHTKGSCGRNSTPPPVNLHRFPSTLPTSGISKNQPSQLFNLYKLISIGKPCTPPKFNSSPVKNDGWKTTLLLGCQILRGHVC